MKTAISIPDKIFEAAEDLSHKLKLSRSELYAKAIEKYINDRDEKQILQKLNEIYSKETSNLDTDVKKMQHNSLNLDKDEW